MTTPTARHPAPRGTAPVVVVVVALGGAVGALLRVAAGLAWPVGPGAFPWTTLVVNVTGAAALAALPALSVVRRHPLLLPALGTGLLGGYTTLSAASAETVALLDAGRGAAALAYSLGTLVACLAAVALVRRATDGPR